MSTDYPLVQITDDATGEVAYARTHGMSNRSIAPGAASSAQFTLPAGIATGRSELRVEANGIASAPVQVIVAPVGMPVVTAVSPASGSVDGGTAVTISGIGFSGATGVTFGATPAASFAVEDDSTVTAVTPPGAVGPPVDVRVTTHGVTSGVSLADAFVYVWPWPSLPAPPAPPPVSAPRPAVPVPPSEEGARPAPPGQP